MTARIARVGLILPLLALTTPTTGGEVLEPQSALLKGHVTTLASAGFQGRRGEGGRKTATYLVEAFRTLGLKPLFGDSFLQPIPASRLSPVPGQNVGAVLRGTDPKLRDEWVIVSAHYDHLGTRGAVLYPGADDNASGVAMMLEVARSLARSPEPPRRSVMFIGFDLEEIGLFGSRYFVEHSPVPLDRIALFITADMIGRSLGGVCDRHVFVMGTEHAPGLRPWIAQAAKDRPVTVGLLGSDLLILNRSDYGPFRARSVPYLFFSTGENPRYHSPSDTAETIEYPKLEAISRVILAIVRHAATAEAVPKWSASPDNSLEEAVTIRDVMRTFLEHRESLELGRAQTLLLTNAIRTLDAIVKRGSITPEERSGIIQVARIVLATVL
jgi:hypothetical protein